MGSPAVFHLLNDRATARRALQSQLLLRQTGKEVWRAPLHTHTPSHPRQVGEAWGKNLTVVIAGLTNTYASYVTTFEEYQAQRYEGGFTLFGPNTLDAYIQVKLESGKRGPRGSEVRLGGCPGKCLRMRSGRELRALRAGSNPDSSAQPPPGPSASPSSPTLGSTCAGVQKPGKGHGRRRSAEYRGPAPAAQPAQ